MTVSVSYLCKNWTTCLFISKSFKELFFKYFLFESGCKGKAYFWTAKTFWSFFLKKSFFWSGSIKIPDFVQYFNSSAFLSRKRVQSYCFTTYPPNINNSFFALFCSFPAKSLILKRCRRADFKASNPVNKASYLNIYTRARIYRGLPKTTCISYIQKIICRFTINNGVWYTEDFLHSSYTTKKMTVFFKNMTAF